MLASPTRGRPLNLDLSHVPKWPAKSPTLSPPDLQAHTMVSKCNLHVGQLIGSGSFGMVYEGRLENRKVALKRLRVSTKTEDLVWSSFLSELRGAHLKHANIVDVFGALMHQDSPCLVMEYAGDYNLQEVIDDPQQQLPLKRRAHIVSAVVSGLEYIHEKSITHLDLKPANLIMSDEGSCKIADFGCSLMINDDNPDGGLKPSTYLTGTHAYKAPELLLGEFPTVQADIYSLGICMWQMLVREEPYKGEDSQLVIFGVATNTIRPRLPHDLCDTDAGYLGLFQKCWDGSPNGRPTATALKVLVVSELAAPN